MSYMGSLAKKIGDKISNTIGDKITTAIGGAIVVLLGLAWVWLYNRMNPEFSYEAVPSSGASHFVGLANVLKQIDKDSHVYCSGGWDQRIARLALRRCYEFSFAPDVAYSTYACSADPAAISVSTSDQLVALQRFEKRFEGCLVVSQGSSETSYVVRPGERSSERSVQFGTASPDKSFFCGCGPDDQKDIATTIGAEIK